MIKLVPGAFRVESCFDFTCLELDDEQGSLLFAYKDPAVVLASETKRGHVDEFLHGKREALERGRGIRHDIDVARLRFDDVGSLAVVVGDLGIVVDMVCANEGR